MVRQTRMFSSRRLRKDTAKSRMRCKKVTNTINVAKYQFRANEYVRRRKYVTEIANPRHRPCSANRKISRANGIRNTNDNRPANDYLRKRGLTTGLTYDSLCLKRTLHTVHVMYLYIKTSLRVSIATTNCRIVVKL